MNAGLLLFAGILIGGLVGSLITDYIWRMGEKRMMKDGDLFVRANGKWYPRSPFEQPLHSPFTKWNDK